MTEVEKIELWGNDGVFARFTRAAKGIHRIAEECREVMARQSCPHCGHLLTKGRE